RPRLSRQGPGHRRRPPLQRLRRTLRSQTQRPIGAKRGPSPHEPPTDCDLRVRRPRANVRGDEPLSPQLIQSIKEPQPAKQPKSYIASLQLLRRDLRWVVVRRVGKLGQRARRDLDHWRRIERLGAASSERFEAL